MQCQDMSIHGHTPNDLKRHTRVSKCTYDSFNVIYQRIHTGLEDQVDPALSRGASHEFFKRLHCLTTPRPHCRRSGLSSLASVSGGALPAGLALVHRSKAPSRAAKAWPGVGYTVESPLAGSDPNTVGARSGVDKHHGDGNAAIVFDIRDIGKRQAKPPGGFACQDYPTRGSSGMGTGAVKKSL